MKNLRQRIRLSSRGPYEWAIELDGDIIGYLISTSVRNEWRIRDNFGRDHEMRDFPTGEKGRMDMAVQFATFLDLEGK